MKNSGIPYFPLDCILDDKFALIEAQFGLKGFAVIVKLLQKIYGGEGYYGEWTEEIGLLFARNVGQDYELVSDIVEAAIKRGMFDKNIFDKYHVLTSKGVQERYLAAVSRRKNVELKEDYLLINVNDLPKNVYIKCENDDKKTKNANKNKQRRVKKSKQEESKEIENALVAPIVDTYDFSDKVKSKFIEFITNRILLNKEPTERAITILCNKMKEHNEAENIKTIDASIVGGWTGLFYKDDNQTKAKSAAMDNDHNYDTDEIEDKLFGDNA